MSRQSNTIHSDLAEVVSAARKLTIDDHGKTFFLNLAAGFQVDLPAVEAGLRYKFVVKTAPTGAGYTVKSNNTSGSATALIKGHVLSADLNAASDGDIDTTAIGTLTFVVNKAVAGDWCELECDGTNWFYSARASVFDGFTGT